LTEAQQQDSATAPGFAKATEPSTATDEDHDARTMELAKWHAEAEEAMQLEREALEKEKAGMVIEIEDLTSQLRQELTQQAQDEIKPLAEDEEKRDEHPPPDETVEKTPAAPDEPSKKKKGKLKMLKKNSKRRASIEATVMNQEAIKSATSAAVQEKRASGGDKEGHDARTMELAKWHAEAEDVIQLEREALESEKDNFAKERVEEWKKVEQAVEEALTNERRSLESEKANFTQERVEEWKKVEEASEALESEKGNFTQERVEEWKKVEQASEALEREKEAFGQERIEEWRKVEVAKQESEEDIATLRLQLLEAQTAGASTNAANLTDSARSAAVQYAEKLKGELSQSKVAHRAAEEAKETAQEECTALQRKIQRLEVQLRDRESEIDDLETELDEALTGDSMGGSAAATAAGGTSPGGTERALSPAQEQANADRYRRDRMDSATNAAAKALAESCRLGLSRELVTNIKEKHERLQEMKHREREGEASLLALQQEVCKLREYQDNLEHQLEGGANKPPVFREPEEQAKAGRKRDMVSEGLAEAGKSMSSFFSFGGSSQKPP